MLCVIATIVNLICGFRLAPKEKIETNESGLTLFESIFVDFEAPSVNKDEPNDILLRVTFTIQVGLLFQFKMSLDFD